MTSATNMRHAERVKFLDMYEEFDEIMKSRLLSGDGRYRSHDDRLKLFATYISQTEV